MPEFTSVDINKFLNIEPSTNVDGIITYSPDTPMPLVKDGDNLLSRLLGERLYEDVKLAVGFAGDGVFEQVKLLRLDILDRDNLASSTLALGLQWDASLTLIPDLLSVEKPSVTLSVAGQGEGRYYEAMLYGRVVLGGTGTMVFLRLPEFHLEGYMEPGESYTFGPLIEQLGFDDSPFDDLAISGLRFEADLRGDSKALVLAVQLSDVWESDNFELHTLDFTLGYIRVKQGTTSLSHVSGAFTAALTLAEVEWEASVEFPYFRGGAEMVGGAYKIGPLLKLLHLEGFGLDDLTLAGGSLDFDLPERTATAHLELDDVWKIGPLNLSRVSFDLTYIGGPEGGAAGRVAAELELGTGQTRHVVSFSGDHSGPGQGWQMHGTLEVAAESPLTFWTLAKALGVDEKELGPVSGLKELALTRADIRYDTKTGHLAAGCTLKLDAKADLTLRLERTPTVPKKQYNTFFSGQLLAAGVALELIFDKAGDGTTLVGAYTNPAGGAVSIGDMVKALITGADSADAMLGAFKVKDAVVVYDRSATGKKALFAVDMDGGIDLGGLGKDPGGLGKLPLVGPALAGETLRLAFTLLYASAPFDAEKDLNHIRPLLPSGAPKLPGGNIAQGPAIEATMQLGDQRVHIELGGDATSQGGSSGSSVLPKNDPRLGSPTTSPAAVTRPPATLPATPPDNVTWVNAQKSFGPLHVQRVGVGYANDQIIVLLDATLSVGGLTIALLGLGAAYNLKAPHLLTFALHGMGLDLTRGPVGITAAFLNMGGDFLGEATIRTQNLSLTAIGGYSSDNAALFIYALLDYPLGGPVFFFVEGLALGFGNNRRLTIPPIDQLESFPLVADAIKPRPISAGADRKEQQDQLSQKLGKLHYYLAPSAGEYFLAVGLKFNSFRLIDVFALLTMALDLNTGRFKVDILGIATAQVPSDVPRPLAVIQMAFHAFFDFTEGVLGVQAQLTSQSWILAPECRLSGGYAFYTWFSGDHAGDFVNTLGGYHPSFRLPDHYPRVPRLAFNWQVSSQLSIKGDAYYAMTPMALMAGGHLHATWNSGNLRAWFDVGVDFLIQWQPLHYEATAHLEIGASYTLSVLGISHTFSVSVGAHLEMWGPEFSGRAKVKVGPIPLEVSFGDRTRTSLQPLGWDAFVKAFLPNVNGVIDPKLLSFTVRGGLLRTFEYGGAQWWAINPKAFALDVSTLVPLTNVTLGAPPETRGETEIEDSERKFGVAPMGPDKSLGRSEFNVQIIRRQSQDDSPAELAFGFAKLPKNFPAGLWGKGFQKSGGDRLIKGIGGLIITPREPPHPGTTSDIPRRNLDYDLTPLEVAASPAPDLRWEDLPEAKQGEATMAAALADAQVADRRRELLAALGIDAAQAVHVRPELAQAFVISPRIVAST